MSPSDNPPRDDGRPKRPNILRRSMSKLFGRGADTTSPAPPAPPAHAPGFSVSAAASSHSNVTGVVHVNKDLPLASRIFTIPLSLAAVFQKMHPAWRCVFMDNWTQLLWQDCRLGKCCAGYGLSEFFDEHPGLLEVVCGMLPGEPTTLRVEVVGAEKMRLLRRMFEIMAGTFVLDDEMRKWMEDRKAQYTFTPLRESSEQSRRLMAILFGGS